MATKPESERATEGNTRQDLGQAELGYCDRHRWLHAKDSAPTPPCRNWTAGRGEGLAGLVAQIARALDEHRRVDGLDGRTCTCGWQADKVNPKVYDWQHRLHVGLVIVAALEAAAPAGTALRQVTSDCINQLREMLDRKDLSGADLYALNEAITALATPSTQAPPCMQDHNAKSGFGVFVVTGEHQRTAFFTRAAAEQYLAQQDPERFRIVMYPKPPAATQEQPAGSGAMLKPAIDTVTNLPIGGSPRKVGEDALAKEIAADLEDAGLVASGWRGIKAMEIIASRLRPSSAPVGEQK